MHMRVVDRMQRISNQCLAPKATGAASTTVIRLLCDRWSSRVFACIIASLPVMPCNRSGPSTSTSTPAHDSSRLPVLAYTPSSSSDPSLPGKQDDLGQQKASEVIIETLTPFRSPRFSHLAT